MMAAELKNLSCEIIPYYCVEIPKKPGHPYMTDIIIETSTSASNDMPTLSDTPVEVIPAVSTESNFATVHQSNEVVMVVEIKKSLSVEFKMINPSDIMEILVYCRYILKLHGISTILGVIMYGANWHC